MLFLPVSTGEAVDKLTILDIKTNRITDDNKKNNVKIEYDLLYEKLKDFIETNIQLYSSMKKVNILIWDMMDILRDGSLKDEEYTNLCRKCIKYNDIRFRIKNRINYVTQSILKEEKGYKTTIFVIEINKKDIDKDFIYLMKKPIIYNSLFYDEVYIISKNEIMLNEFKKELKNVYTIKFEEVSEKELLLDKVIFEDTLYNKDEIYQIFNISDNIMNEIL